MDGVPYPQPLAGPEPQYVPWGVLLVRPNGHPPRPMPPRAADQRSRAYPTLLRVLRWGRYGHRGGPQTPEVGSLACVSRGPFASRPPFRCAVCGGWCPVSPGWGGGGGGGGGFVLFLAVLLVCVSPPPVVVVRRRCVCLWRGACARGVRAGVWCVVCGVWCAAVVCGVVGPSPLLAEVAVCYSPPLLAGFRCLWWCAVLRHSWLGFRCRQWRVVCGVWCVVCGERRWCIGGVVAGVWCGWSLATPGGGSLVLLPAAPGWVSLPVVVGGPRHSWLRSPGGGGVWWGCGWCVVCLVPRHSWRRFLCATPRHSWLGFAACGGVRFPATPGWGSGAGSGVCCVVCGVWCVVSGGGVLVGLWLVSGVVGPSPLLAEVPVCYSPPLLVGFRCRWWLAVLATPG